MLSYLLATCLDHEVQLGINVPRGARAGELSEPHIALVPGAEESGKVVGAWIQQSIYVRAQTAGLEAE